MGKIDRYLTKTKYELYVNFHFSDNIQLHHRGLKLPATRASVQKLVQLNNKGNAKASRITGPM